MLSFYQRVLQLNILWTYVLCEMDNVEKRRRKKLRIESLN